MVLKALVTGVTGQTGSYISELLESKGYEVHGFVRRSAVHNLQNLSKTNVIFHYGDITDATSIYEAVREVMPDEVYHFAAQSFVKMSFFTPIDTGNITGLGTARVLETIRQLKPDTKFYQASSSEMYGASPAPQNESTPFYPISPYSTAKLYAYWQTRMYREFHHMFAVNGIMFNNESPRRGVEFVSRKIVKGVADIVKRRARTLGLGNLDAKRDWSHAKDTVRAAYLTMQHSTPDDWVIASGETHTVKEFVIEAFKYVGLDWEQYVVIDDRYKRPSEVHCLLGDSTKARTLLGWKPEYTFESLVKEMVETELLAT